MTGGRWGTYALMADAGLSAHWEARLATGAKIALLLGSGFDPRMCIGPQMLHARAPDGALTLHTITFDAPTDAIGQQMATDNRAELSTIAAARPIIDRALAGRTLDEVARASAGLVGAISDLGEVTDVVVDINALPRAVFFPLVAKLLYLCDKVGPDAPNLHVIGGDAAWLDAAMRREGIAENAGWLYPFAGTFAVEATSHVPRVWLPILGENTATQLERIYNLVEPAEVCPLLPFPARDPRRADALFAEYHQVLFERLRTDSGTVIYGAEANPFQIYRRLRDSAVRYRQTLERLGGCKTAFSALSSKLVAVGVLLAAYELGAEDHEVGIADIGAQTVVLDRHIPREEAAEGTTMLGFALSGDTYV